jgi:hypothetical protein
VARQKESLLWHENRALFNLDDRSVGVLLDNWRSSLRQIGKDVRISERTVVRHLTDLTQSKFKHPEYIHLQLMNPENITHSTSQ